MAKAYQLVLTFPGAVTVGGARLDSGAGKVNAATANANTVTVELSEISTAQRIVVKVYGLSDGVTTGEVTVPMHVLVGDADGNGNVTSSDTGRIQAQLNLPVEAANFRCDLNANGAINSSDVGLVKASSGGAVPPAPMPAPSVDVAYEYHPDGKTKRLFLPPTAYDFTFAYDQTGRLQDIVQAGAVGLAYQYGYDLASNITQRYNYRNGVNQVYSYDQLNRLQERTIRAFLPPDAAGYRSPYEFSHEHYSYDALRRLSATDREEDGRRDAFSYNDAGELARADYGMVPNGGGGFGVPLRYATYLPDKAGNRTQVDANGMLLPFSPNLLNQYAQTSNGQSHEISGYQNVSYQYVGDTRLSRASSTASGVYELGYDALGRCVKRTTNGVSVYSAYDGERPVKEFNAAGTVLASSVYGIGIDEIIARYNNGLTQYLQQDRLGNVSAITDANGEVTESYRYDAFGTPYFFSAPTLANHLGSDITASGTAVNNRFLFTGREWVARFGFYEYRNRAYHPGLGRFMSEDPKSFAAGDRNLFRYCGGDPVNRVDPMGLETFDTLPEAVSSARAQVINLGFENPKNGPYIRELHNAFTRSVSVSIAARGKRFETSEPAYGVVKSFGKDKSGKLVEGKGSRNPDTGKYWYFEVEEAKAGFMSVHGHNDRTGVATPGFSRLDYDAAATGKIIDRVDESKPRKWHRIGKSGKMDASAPIKKSDYTSNDSNNNDSVQTASAIDAQLRAAENRGVPSLGAETTNRAFGPN